MLRPCFLVVDREQAGSISTRKLVIETAKFNVITAYSGAEAIEALEKFPKVDGVVIDSATPDLSCTELAKRLKEMQPGLRIVSVGRTECAWADHQLESFDPKGFLALLEKLEPKKSEEIARHERLLEAQLRG